MPPWRMLLQPSFRAPMLVLQWGHGEFAVENAGSQDVYTLSAVLLQWSHGTSTMEKKQSRRGITLDMALIATIG